MNKKRYAIVRAKNICPLFESENLCELANDCWSCKINKNYGDTKEQLTLKIAQVLLREELDWHREHLDIIPKGKIDEPLVRILYEHCLDKAKKIVEFLGVEE